MANVCGCICDNIFEYDDDTIACPYCGYRLDGTGWLPGWEPGWARRDSSAKITNSAGTDSEAE